MKKLTKDALTARRGIILADLLGKVEAEDFHGVQDCASDIREIDAQLEILQQPSVRAEADIPCQHPKALTRFNNMSGLIDCTCGASFDPAVYDGLQRQTSGRM